MSDERDRLQAEYNALGMMNASTMTADQRVASRKRLDDIRHRILVLDGAANEAGIWHALSAERRLELMALCCRGCGSLDAGCWCEHDD